MLRSRHPLLLLALLLAGCSFVPSTTGLADLPARSFAGTGWTVRGQFLEYYDRNGGLDRFGPPLSDAIWLDGRPAQFFRDARIELDPARGRVVLTALPSGWQSGAPPELLDLGASDYRATLTSPGGGEPLAALPVSLQVPGYSGPIELRLYDARMRPAGSWQAQVVGGYGVAELRPRGALGPQMAVALVDGRVAGVAARLLVLDARTVVETGQPRLDELYPAIRRFMAQDVVEYELDGAPVRGYRSPDNNLLWLRDHAYQARGFRYFEHDVTSLVDAFRRAQRPDGSFPDYLARPAFGVDADRKDVEADVEYLFVQAVYEAWQATGDDEWLRANLEPMRRAVRYTLSDRLRWDEARGLVKRAYTIDTWDFAYGPTTRHPQTGRPAPRHWIDEDTVFGIFHGDNTGLAHALELLARVEERVGSPTRAVAWRAQAGGILERLDELSWNGAFYTHFVPLRPFTPPGVDAARQLSLSNAIALNRGVLRSEQGRAIVEEYFRRGAGETDAFAEWYSIDPPFPAGSYGLAGGKGELPGEYVNGGIMPLVGGELARGAFRHGTERYGFAILDRYHFLVASTGASYLWYYPAGNPGKSGPDTLSTDGWGASAMLAALIEGAAGVEDEGALYRAVTLSPRWSAADDVRAARVVARYGASGGYVAYRWERAARGLRLELTGSGERATVRLLLPAEAGEVRAVRLDGAAWPHQVDDVFGSRYVELELGRVGGVVEVEWARSLETP